MTHRTHLLTIGYAKQMLVRGSREHARALLYADRLRSVHAIVFTRRQDGHARPLRTGNLTVYPTHSRSRLFMLIDAVRIGWNILQGREEGPWLISSQDPFETSLIGRFLSMKFRIPHHVQLHGDNYGSPAWRTETFLNVLRYWFGLYILRTARRVRVVSFRIKHSLVARGISAERITVLPIRPELEDFLRVSKKLHDRFTFLYVGRLSPEKDVPRIIRAFHAISPLCDAKLRIVGEGKMKGELLKLAERLQLTDRIEFVSWTDSVPEMMAEADTLLLASKHEAYGLVLIEALAAGLPVVTTDVGCVGEVVEDGLHGVVVKEDGLEAYAGAMRRMVADEAFRKKCETAGRKKAEELASHSALQYADAWVTAISEGLSRV